MSDLSDQPELVPKVKGSSRKTVLAISVSFLSMPNGQSSMDLVIGGLVCVTRVKEWLLIMKSVRLLGGIRINAIALEELQSAESDLIRMLLFGGFGIYLWASDGRGLVSIIECLNR